MAVLKFVFLSLHSSGYSTTHGCYFVFIQQTTKRPADVSSPSERTPGSKRKRKPAELYQSDVIDACSKQTRSSSDAKREVFLPKGGYVAVRSEDGKQYKFKSPESSVST